MKTKVKDTVEDREDVVVPAQPVAVSIELPQAQAVLSAEGLIQLAISKNLPVETMERLLAMRKELKQEKAKEDYDRAMAQFQKDCPTIEKTKEVVSNGKVVYKYAPIESIVEQVKEVLAANGFSYATNMVLLENGVKVTVKTTHSSGHSEVSEMEVPFGNKTQVMSPSQVVAAAQTFAKRYAFCNAFGIMTGDEDTDAKPSEAPAETKPALAKVRATPEQNTQIMQLLKSKGVSAEKAHAMHDALLYPSKLIEWLLTQPDAVQAQTPVEKEITDNLTL